MATNISEEELNHIRVSSLLLRIAPRAIRTLFDKVFPPTRLQAVLQMSRPKLENLKKKRVINKAQWELLFPTSKTTDVKSDSFDVTLMVCLLRNLKNFGIQDSLPGATDTSIGADISRIKYYRNVIAHSGDGQICSTEFQSLWDELTSAIVRLGGQAFMKECKDLKVASLDQQDKEILLEIHSHRQELKDLKEAVTELKDPVPSNVKEIQRLTLQSWEKDDHYYVETRAFQHLKERITECTIITIVGNPGTGKSSLMHHLALTLNCMKNKEILPIHFASDIVKHNNPEKCQIFVIDDVCGKYSVISQQLDLWLILKDDLETILQKGDCKILTTCRANIYNSSAFQRLTMLTANVCNLSSENFQLLETEQSKIASAYLTEDEATLVKELSNPYQYDFFPLLCKLYPENRQHKVEDFFTRPIKAIEENLLHFKGQDNNIVFYCLALLVVFNNSIRIQWLSGSITDEDKNMLQTLTEECEMSGVPSQKRIERTLDSLIGSYLTKADTSYRALHDKLFDVLAHFFGTDLFDVIIQFADKHFIAERYQFESTVDEYAKDYAIIVSNDKETDYFNRIAQDIDVSFDNSQLANSSYRKRFQQYCIENNQWITQAIKELDKSSSPPPIVRMATCGYLDMIKMLLDFQVFIHVKDSLGRTLIHIAVENNNTEMLSLLLEANADPNLPDKQQFTPLCIAAGLGRTVLCEKLLLYGADPDRFSVASMFPLYWATMNGFAKTVEVLLKYKANPTLKNSNCSSPLDVACRHGNLEIVNFLVKAGVPVQPHDDISPLLLASSRGHKEIVKLLLDNHADCKHLVKGRSVLNEAVRNRHLDVVKILLEHGADPNMADVNDDFPLLIAANAANVELVNLLLNFKANVNKNSKNLHTPLSVSAYLGNVEVADCLLKCGANPGYTNISGDTALHKAVRSGYTQLLELLLQYKADPNAQNKCGNTCVSDAAFYGQENAVRKLLHNGADINICNTTGESPLLRASRAGNTSVVEILLMNNADVNSCDVDGNSSLAEASFYGNFDCAFILLKRKADPNISNKVGATALHRSVCAGKLEIVELLLNHDANLSAVNEAGLTPKDLASFSEESEICELLIDYENLQ